MKSFKNYTICLPIKNIIFQTVILLLDLIGFVFYQYFGYMNQKFGPNRKFEKTKSNILNISQTNDFVSLIIISQE
jgi:hypothetical protein